MPAAAPLMLAASAAPAGATGSYGATSLTSAGEWAAGGASGGFSWEHPLETPEAHAGPEPEISLDYSSQAVDGRTASTNNQAS
ncbi:hypothetical protein ACFCWB_34280 [Streptomyces bacillaris]|uniref:hypothetical protein n=1 Tax=Streptomyces bacillaris TaxID=68179 RepID=UPI0035D8303F